MQEDYFLGSLYAKERISFVDNYVKASKELENNPTIGPKRPMDHKRVC